MKMYCNSSANNCGVPRKNKFGEKINRTGVSFFAIFFLLLSEGRFNMEKTNSREEKETEENLSV